jgi:site-specific DNA-methyltransferase (adenine-specific)
MNTKLICGQFEEITKDQLGVEKIHLCFLDPPDNEGRDYEGYNDKIDREEYVRLLRAWLLNAVLITNGPVFFSFAEKWIPEVERIIRCSRIPLIQRILWTYNFGQANKTRYAPCFRPIYWLNRPTIYPEKIKIPSARQVKYSDKRAASGGKLPNNVWNFPRICGTFKEKRKWHKTQHPEDLLRRIILGHSQKGDVVLDGFIGSGTTAYVCEELERQCMGIDVSQFYLTMIEKELQERFSDANNNY